MVRVHETVYISGPMSTSGEPGQNLHNAVKASAKLVYEGFLTYVPHLTWLQHAIQPWVAVRTWERMTLAWVSRCDILLRLPGDSKGADEEVERANSLSIPVFCSVDDVIRYYRKEGDAHGLNPEKEP
jgi:hypothetical protein